MRREYIQNCRDWLFLAEEDILLGQRAVKHAPILGGGAVFHAQQAAEKALKEFLTAHGRALVKTHELVSLITACVAIDPDFGDHLHAAQTLSPYISRFRYPFLGMPLRPSDDEAREALELANGWID